MVKTLEQLYDKVKNNPPKTIAVASPESLDILKLVQKTKALGLADFILIGNKENILKIAEKNECEINNFEIINQPDSKLAAEMAVNMVKTGEANIIMKGMLHTSTFLKAVLDKEKGLNTGNLISQISIFDKEYGEGLQMLTDCAMLIQPNLRQKKQLIENAVDLAIKLGYETPKVAILSALEVVNEQIPETLEAAILSKMAERGQIKNAIVDGPFALDNAVSPEAAANKNLSGQVAGKADILIAPNLQVGNALTKSLTYFAKKKVAAAVMGANAPIVMTSRTDTIENKLISIVLASYIS